VAVFTHDLVFLWMLSEAAGERDVEVAPRYFRRDSTGAGLVSEEWPWDGTKVPVRIAALRADLPSLKALAATDRPRYEALARDYYGKLRETWERAVEEVLFNGALKRFSQQVQTLRLRNLHRITQTQMETFEKGMTKTSSWIRGHDHAAALTVPIPEPPELEADLNTLDAWVKEVKTAHKD
jgi:hypothetical protein